MYNLISLACEIDFIKLSSKTLELVRNGDSRSWKKIDHLQFLVAVQRGHWGMNSLAVIKEWATFHLMEEMKNLQLWFAFASLPPVTSKFTSEYTKSSNKYKELLNKKRENFEESFDSLRYIYEDRLGMWRTDHLEFLLQKRSIDTYKPVDIKRHVEFCLRRYKLCCMCYALLCDNNFVRFVDKEYSELGILACTDLWKVDTCTFKLCYVTPDGYIYSEGESKEIHKVDKLPTPDGPFPAKEQELPWVELYTNCKYIPHCVNLHSGGNEYWGIGDIYGHSINLEHLYDNQGYQFYRDDFLLAMGALSDYIKNSSQVWRQECFAVGPFDNKGDGKAFDEEMLRWNSKIESASHEIKFIEMKVVLDPNVLDRHVSYYMKAQVPQGFAPDKQDAIRTLLSYHQNEPATRSITTETFNDRIKNWSTYVSACRFIFAKFETKNPNVEEGILFYTNTHYGYNLIVFDNRHINKLKNCKWCYDEVRKVKQQYPKFQLFGRKWKTFIDNFCLSCWNKMLRVTLNQMKGEGVFPYAKIGRLSLTYNKDNQLVNIDLSVCE